MNQKPQPGLFQADPFALAGGGETAALRREVDRWRRERMETVKDMLAHLTGSWNPRLALDPKHEFALLHHTLYQAVQAAEAGDSAAVDRALALWDLDPGSVRLRVQTEVGSLLVASADACVRHDDLRMLSPVYVLEGETLQREAPSGTLLAEAVRNVAATGFADYLRTSLSVIVWLERRTLADTLDSYSLTPFPLTVYSDHVDDPVCLGESILHESVHCWLNQCLRATGTVLPEQPQWYSPWKDRLRPAFGILHAGVTFALLTVYLRRARDLPTTGRVSRAYCSARLEDALARLGCARPAYAEAARLVGDASLRRWLERAFACALDGVPDPAMLAAT